MYAHDFCLFAQTTQVKLTRYSEKFRASGNKRGQATMLLALAEPGAPADQGSGIFPVPTGPSTERSCAPNVPLSRAFWSLVDEG